MKVTEDLFPAVTTKLSIEGFVNAMVGGKTVRGQTSNDHVEIDRPEVPGGGHETVRLKPTALREWAAFYVAAAQMWERAHAAVIDEHPDDEALFRERAGTAPPQDQADGCAGQERGPDL